MLSVEAAKENKSDISQKMDLDSAKKHSSEFSTS